MAGAAVSAGVIGVGPLMSDPEPEQAAANAKSPGSAKARKADRLLGADIVAQCAIETVRRKDAEGSAEGKV